LRIIARPLPAIESNQAACTTDDSRSAKQPDHRSISYGVVVWLVVSRLDWAGEYHLYKQKQSWKDEPDELGHVFLLDELFG
jgi:hypothetical protein